MARYILCPSCNQNLLNLTKQHGEFMEFIRGYAKYLVSCDTCGKGIAENDECFAVCSLDSKEHPNYAIQNPLMWAEDYIDTF